MSRYYVGLMSGTSLDGMDAVLVEFTPHGVLQVEQTCLPIPDTLRTTLLETCGASHIAFEQLACLDVEVAHFAANAVCELLDKAHVTAQDIIALGSHGQTLYHAPHGTHPTTLQVGDPNIIAEQTGITTVADFRRRDIAVKGQGAPLVPAFHHAVFSSDDETRIILNIGGIANITLLPRENTGKVIGFDTGPGNVLMDHWYRQHHNGHYDQDGNWATSGQVIDSLLQEMLEEDYFKLSPPKSTGRELFNARWLTQKLNAKNSHHKTEDIQATLCELTALSISQGIYTWANEAQRVIVCGGGAHNAHLLKRLQAHLELDVETSKQYGIAPDWVEATAFAWLAKQTMEKQPGNLPSVTGAQRAVILGGVYAKNGM